jgi:hypothetical protein
MRLQFPVAQPPKMMRKLVGTLAFLVTHVVLDATALAFSLEAEFAFDMQHCAGQHFVNAGDSLFIGSVAFLLLNLSFGASIAIQLSVYFCDFTQIYYCCVMLSVAVACNYYSSSNYVRPALATLWIPFHLYAMSKTPTSCFTARPSFGSHLWLYSYVYLAWIFATLFYMYWNSQYSVLDCLGVEYSVPLPPSSTNNNADGDSEESEDKPAVIPISPPQEKKETKA